MTVGNPIKDPNTDLWFRALELLVEAQLGTPWLSMWQQHRDLVAVFSGGCGWSDEPIEAQAEDSVAHTHTGFANPWSVAICLVWDQTGTALDETLIHEVAHCITPRHKPHHGKDFAKSLLATRNAAMRLGWEGIEGAHLAYAHRLPFTLQRAIEDGSLIFNKIAAMKEVMTNEQAKQSQEGSPER